MVRANIFLLLQDGITKVILTKEKNMVKVHYKNKIIYLMEIFIKV